MLGEHRAQGADVTIVSHAVSEAEAPRSGLLRVDPKTRTTPNQTLVTPTGLFSSSRMPSTTGWTATKSSRAASFDTLLRRCNLVHSPSRL